MCVDQDENHDTSKDHIYIEHNEIIIGARIISVHILRWRHKRSKINYIGC